MRAKSIEFVNVVGQVIWTEVISTISISLADGSRIELQNVARALESHSNLISVGQLREHRIKYHDISTAMTLMRVGKVIAHAKKNRNLFTLELA